MPLKKFCQNKGIKVNTLNREFAFSHLDQALPERKRGISKGTPKINIFSGKKGKPERDQKTNQPSTPVSQSPSPSLPQIEPEKKPEGTCIDFYGLTPPLDDDDGSGEPDPNAMIITITKRTKDASRDSMQTFVQTCERDRNVAKHYSLQRKVSALPEGSYPLSQTALYAYHD